MKLLVLIISITLFTISTKAQVNSADSTKNKIQSVIKKNDGSEYVGIIKSDDGREVLIETKTLGKIYIRKSEIKRIVLIEDSKSIINGEYQPEGPITTRYAFTNNALPIRKGENYTAVNLFGPEVHFATSDNFNIGIMSTWIASPLVLAMKYTFKTKESKVNFSIGTLLGTPGYLTKLEGGGGLHWASVTAGTRKKNITFSAGYGYYKSRYKRKYPELGVYYNTGPDYSYPREQNHYTHGPIFSIAGITKIGAKVSFVFDSMFGIFKIGKTESKYQQITPTYVDDSGTWVEGEYSITVSKAKYSETALFVMPGLRFQHSDNKVFQMSLAGVSLFKRDISIPFPMATWFYAF